VSSRNLANEEAKAPYGAVKNNHTGLYRQENKKKKHLIRHTIRHNEFAVNILEGAIFGKKGRGKTSTTILEASLKKHWS
jgi:hypothetical protein